MQRKKKGTRIMEPLSKIEPILSGAGIPVFGCCPFEPLRPHLLECRAKGRLPADAASVLVALFPYAMEEAAYRGGNLSRYAAVGDYHEIVPQYLERAVSALEQAYPGEAFVPFTDNSPIPEVRAAALAGLGRIGQNGLLIHECYGSWVFIGEIVTTLSINAPPHKIRPCIGCGRCITACPTGALAASRLDQSKCMSALTQRKGSLSEQEAFLIRRSGCAWGCDICQAACPMNARAAIQPLPEFVHTFQASAAENGLLEGRAYAWRGRKVIERNLKLLSDPPPGGGSQSECLAERGSLK